MKDMIFASTLNQIAKVYSIETSYDNKYNRPESIEIIKEYPCRLSRKNNAYPNASNGGIIVVEQMRAYFEIDADIKKGMTIEIEGTKYKAGMPYKPNNHHLEVDMNNISEA